jgi:hypothetical protein
MKPNPEVGVYEPPHAPLPYLAYVRKPDGTEIIKSFETKDEAMQFVEAHAVDVYVGPGVRR